MKKIKKIRPGLTLVELIIAIAILGIIVIGFLPIFTMSARINNRSQATLDATYVGRDSIERIYTYIDSERNKYEEFDELVSIISDKIKAMNDYEPYLEKTEEDKYLYSYKYYDSKYIKINFKQDENLIGVVVRVYKDKDMNDLEVQYESLYSWKGSEF